jgi:hypothetical protein
MGLMDETNVVWQPLPGSQVLALSAPINHILFEGTRGPGKTDTQLMRFRRLVGRGYGKFWRGIIFDRQYKNLQDLLAKSQRWFSEFGDGASFSGAGGGGRWKWQTGEELYFRHIKKPGDYWHYHGHEYPYIGWNELTKYPTSELYFAMMSCNRTSYIPANYPVYVDKRDLAIGLWTLVSKGHPYAQKMILPEIPLEVFSTTNPFGPGHNWVKREFVDVAKPGEVVRKVINVFNPRTQEREDVVKTQVRIFGSYKENRYLSPEYIAELETISEDNRRRAWLWGDWDVIAGGAFDDLWNTDIHVIPRFEIPKSWRCDRTLDWGSTHPFWVGWWALANGERVKLENGLAFTPARGSLILFHEWYGTKTIGTNIGLKMSAKDVAKGIKNRERDLRDAKMVSSPIYAGAADNQISNVYEKQTDTIEKIMKDNGVFWLPSDKGAGSRKNGLQLFRDRLQASVTGEGPAIYFMSHCAAAVGTIPVLPRDEDDQDDVDTDAEDHPWDGTRYRVLAGANRIATEVSVTRPS